ncbi:pectate lyase [Macrococcus hajekii]|uniref:Pectate lyase n=1 Tax=Macrococcus hajekii TaxID=198482 RepID=A0A4R6BID5_9STAP|nr:glycosyl hydrolase family 28-related protein [Macrococcus hajekii]TDM01328.1 pectate lyase [Macrococcus hajekii]GGB10728.1 pectate lyase [Macrococcus hajekii]
MKKITVTEYGAKGRHLICDTIGFQRALNQAKKQPVEIYVPVGTYYIVKELVIYHHTTLILHKDAVIRRISNGALLKNGEKPGYKGYEGNGHIKIKGGTFDQFGHVLNFNNTIMSLGHAREIKIEDVTFKNVVGGHAIDACGLDGFHVKNCHFLGFRDDSGKRQFSEAIQIDLQLKDSFPKFGYYDGTPTKNVIIEGCYFGNSGESMMQPWNRAIGSHASQYDIYYENIFIENNTFEGMGDYAVTLLKSKTVHVTGNKFYNCAGGVRYLAVNKGKYSTTIEGEEKGVQAGEEVIISRNEFQSIKNEEVILIKSYKGVKNSDIYIYDNTFSENENCVIKLKEAKDVYCHNNHHLNALKDEHVEGLYSDL